MSLKDKIPKISFSSFKLPEVSPALYWRLGLVGLVLLNLLLVAIIWISGSSETRDAFHDGRRYFIRMDNGVIEGKNAVAEAPPVPKSETPAAPVEKTDHPEEAPPAPKPEGEIQLAPGLTEAENAPITPATVPMAAIREDLTEKTPDGLLPVISSDGTKSWRYYAKPYDRKNSLPMIAIIVTGLGESKAASEDAARLPENFSLSFSPYAKNVENWVKTARIAGHEVFFDLPLEPGNYPASDPGPHGLLVKKDKDENAARLQWLMTRAQGYAGFVTPQNEAFSSNTESFKALLQTLSERGVLLVVGHEPAKSETKQALEAGGGLATVTADALIDEDLSATAIQARLTALEQTAKQRGYAVGIAQSFPLTMQQLGIWAAKLPDHGFALVPVTFIVHLRFS